MSDNEQAPASSQALLALLQAEWESLQAVLSGLTADQWTKSDLENSWSVKDVVAHLTAWEGRMLGWLDESFRGMAPERPAPGMTWEDLDRLNQLTFEENRQASVEQVRLSAVAVHSEVEQIVRRMSDPDLFDGSRYAWRAGDPMWHMVAANTWWHYREHRDQIEAWLSAD